MEDPSSVKECIMSSPAIIEQSKVRAGCRKFAKIKEEIEMRLTTPITEVKNWVSREAGTIITGNAIRGLAVGVLLIAGTGMYFGITAGDEADNPASSERTTNFPVDWEADLEAYRSSFPNYVDEEGNPASSS